MKNICDDCPQLNRVCDGLKSNNKNYCFFHHGHREIQSFQCDDLIDLVDKVIDEANCFTVEMVKRARFEINEYGSDDYYLVSLYFVQDQRYYPVGYIKKRSK